MPIPLAALTLLGIANLSPVVTPARGQDPGQVVEMAEPGSSVRRLMYMIMPNRLDPPKYSPKKFGTDPPQPFEFDWVVNGYGMRKPDMKARNLVFRVFSQDRKQDGDIAPQVCRMLLHLWDLDYKRIRFDHRELYRNIVDVYLCWGGAAPGGEQKMDVDYTPEKPPQEVQVNTIYIYDLGSFTNPIEMAREVAHEYGHAVLTPVGGFETPEDWGNGQLGEKLFLRWCRDEMAAGRITPKDVMGATKEMLDAWLKVNVDPLVLRIAKDGPALELMEGKGQASMDAFTGLVSYADAILPEDVVGDSLKQMANDRAKSYPASLLQACELKGRVVIGLPPLLEGKDFWVPLGGGQVTGATVVKRKGDWAELRPGATAITLHYTG